MRRKDLFRLKEDKAIINRMGFNNGGVAEAVERLKKNNECSYWWEYWKEQDHSQ